MKKTIFRKRFMIILLIILFVSNIFPVYNIFHLAFDENHYKYSNGDGSITCVDDIFKAGGNCKLDTALLNQYQARYHKRADPVFYRLFWRNPLCFWRWAEYFRDDRYNLPYRSWNNIRKKRSSNLSPSTMFQAF